MTVSPGYKCEFCGKGDLYADSGMPDTLAKACVVCDAIACLECFTRHNAKHELEKNKRR